MAKKEAAPAKYNDQSIKALKGADRVRKRPAVIFGSDGLEGCEHSFFEILSNSVDEAREGHGNEIKVTAFKDCSISVDDRGRGVPLGYNEAEQRWNWDLIYCELYAGGKYDNNDGNSAYEFSLGLNGLGACATQYSSEFMEVCSYDGVTESKICFKKGEVVTELMTRPLEKNERRTGTVVHWRPDLEVFTDIKIPKEFFVETMRRQSVVNAGISFILKFEENDGKFSEYKFRYENGISDYIAELAGDSSMTAPVLWHLETQGRDRADKDEYKLKADFSFCVSNQVNALEYYHNSSFLEHGGSPDRAVKVAFVYAIDKYLKSTGKYNKNEDKITFVDVADCLVYVSNSFSTLTSYANQTKKAITNEFIYEAMTDFLKKNLEIYFVENPTMAEVFANQVLVNKRSRENAESARISIKKKLTGTIDITNRVEKFVNCRSKDPNIRELYIVEGDSALGSCKQGRNSEYQAIIPVRGKTLNCMKSSYEKIFKSEIITDLLRVIGCGVELNGKVKTDIAPFDINTLRWSKIIICTDADEDGFQIRTLLLTLFYRLLPSLLKEHKVFIAESPLFEITCKDKIYFAYNEFEKAEILKKLGNQKYTLQRSKGLGENEPDMMWQTTMNPETRRLISVTPADAALTEQIFDTLLGDNLPARKQFIAEHGTEYMSNGKFIVFEGIDGAGKSTQVDLLTKRLRELGCDVFLTAEPTALPSGKALRKALSGEDKKSECEMSTMFVLDRIAHNTDSEIGIIPLCEQGKVVISDRYYYSTLAYQGHTTDYEWVKKMNLLCPEIKRPDLCIYLDLLPEQSLKRITARNEQVEIYENLEKLTKVRNTFLSVIEDLKRDGEKIFIVNADRTISEIANEIFDIVRENLFS